MRPFSRTRAGLQHGDGLEGEADQGGLELLTFTGALKEEEHKDRRHHREEQRAAGAEQLWENGAKVFGHLMDSLLDSGTTSDPAAYSYGWQGWP